MKKKTRPIKDIILLPFVYFSALVMRIVTKTGVKRLPLSRNALLQVGVFPIRNHYYQPQFDYRGVSEDFSSQRKLPGLDLNTAGQLDFLDTLTYADELVGIPDEKSGDGVFYWNNGSLAPGDAEYWYQVVRHLKPRRIVEIGSGFSTLLALRALNKNREEDAAYECEHVCIEPYEMPWLEKTGVTVKRQKVEELDLEYFAGLAEGDILFIDSSHIIRPAGDVLFEYLQILPVLKPGVVVHVHDIFTPYNYPLIWFRENVKFWNEQYLLEAILSNGREWEILAALNYLQHNHHDALKKVCPKLTTQNEPGSLYMKKRG